jgi:HKD family nuclease
LLQEIRRELASADQVDILVSFITVSGVRKLQDVLQQITATGAQGQSATRLRILTTTYTGATEARALDELARLPGCEVRVSLDGRRTRLHAKAWLFQRKTGFGSAYVGSANLSGAALDRRIGVDRQADAACPGGLVCPGHRPLRDALGRQRVPTL